MEILSEQGSECGAEDNTRYFTFTLLTLLAEYKKVYKLFDADGDRDITPEELISILVKLGEVPYDLALYFNDMSTEVDTDYRGVINFMLVLMKYSKSR